MKYYAITDKKTSYCVRKLFMNTRSSKVMIHFRKVQSWALTRGGGGWVLRISNDFLNGLVCSIVGYFTRLLYFDSPHGLAKMRRDS